ncbi:MAG: hypothetical protein CM15mP73_4140 [Hyphomicrobiales bacterium]|nr:MAG: hypothetical protein CM15mP73_4140 [Hyphomicrobiales bacterium]
MQGFANNIAEELSKLDPANTSTYQNNRDKFWKSQ